MLSIAFAAVVGCGGKQQGKTVTEWGDSIATIDSTAYYWQQLADDSARISAVKNNQVVAECVVRGTVYGAKQYEDGEIYILCGQNRISWFDVKNIPSKIQMMTEEMWDKYDSTQEKADAIVNMDR